MGRLFPQIIQQVVRKIRSPFVTIRCWSTLPQWDVNNWMTIQPSHHLVLINGYAHNGPWYDGDSYLSYEDPMALVECWFQVSKKEAVTLGFASSPGTGKWLVTIISKCLNHWSHDSVIALLLNIRLCISEGKLATALLSWF